eukprot:m.345700 g.345700  ORF g.345700 m.345700 type:complete len:534 (+) comp27044_c0_seq1:211-1812(+)
MDFVFCLVVASFTASKATECSVHLFIDPALTSSTNSSHWERIINQPVKDSRNPLVSEDKIYEVRWDNTYPTVMYDITKKKYRLWYNTCISCDRNIKPSDSKPNPIFGCGHPKWHQQFPGKVPWMKAPIVTAIGYAESDDGIVWEKPELGILSWNGTVNNTNLIVQYEDGAMVLYDEQEKNASCKYKLVGGLAFIHCSNRPNVAKDGTVWPPCHNWGYLCSSDGIHFENAHNGSASDHFYDVIGQNDGTENVLIYDESLGKYWGLVRLDAGYVGRDSNPRRTGRFTADASLQNFTAAQQVFNGTADYQIYSVTPWRLTGYRAGYYLGIASFLLLNQTVRTELLQTTDYGKSWEQVRPGSEYIPLGDPGAFDSYTVYSAWSGGSQPVVNASDPETTLLYYAGGNGPHDGQRDDSLGLARTTTHAFAGLKALQTDALFQSIPLTQIIHPSSTISFLVSSTQTIRFNASIQNSEDSFTLEFHITKLDVSHTQSTPIWNSFKLIDLLDESAIMWNSPQRITVNIVAKEGCILYALQLC